MGNSDKSSLRGVGAFVAFFALPILLLYAAHGIFVKEYLAAGLTASQKVYYLLQVTLLGAASVTAFLAGVETLRGGARKPFRWATGILWLLLLVQSFFHPSGPGR
jgi:hypothetical protein